MFTGLSSSSVTNAVGCEDPNYGGERRLFVELSYDRQPTH